MNELFDFDDILIEPVKLSDIRSRSEVNIKYNNGKLPLMTAPMDTVISTQNLNYFLDNDIIPVLPRGIENESKNMVFTSYGLSEFETKFIDNPIELTDKIYVLIDVANGHMREMYKIVKIAKELYGDNLCLMVGNVANPDTFIEYARLNVDYVRIGIGNGNGCWVDDTLINTIDGHKPIQNIELNDKVLTHLGSYKEVINKISYEINDELTLINGEICTNDHELYVINKKDLNLVNENNYTDFAFFVSADKIDENKHLILSWDINYMKLKFNEVKKEKIKIKSFVHDLTVKDDHSYCVGRDNLIVHNCLTTVQTGIGYPMASLIKECKQQLHILNTHDDREYNKFISKTKIVADGGFKKYSDIIKALALGADYVMLGSIFNKALESSGETIYYEQLTPTVIKRKVTIDQYSDDAKKRFEADLPLYKTFRGMSTKDVQKNWGRTELKTSEGIVKTQQVEYTIKGWINNFESYLKSAMSYTGKNELPQFIGGVHYNFITQNSFNRFNK